ncbi:hypothetical protein G6F65_017819 [Rhizopus arrhizus]|nr:hypothetical protein G6F65_017819 [Rhizopus arrhizus]
MAHTRIRKFNTRDTYPEQQLDNDLCQAVGAGNLVFLRGQIGQDLTVEFDRSLLQTSDEHAVADAMFADGGVDTRDPQSTERALLVTTVAVGVLASAHDCLLGNTEHITAAATVTLGGGNDFFVTCAGSYAAFDARHIRSPLSSERHHGLDGGHVGFMNRCRATQLTLGLGGLLGQNVALERLTALDGAAAANLKALGGAFLGFHLGHDDSLNLNS